MKEYLEYKEAMHNAMCKAINLIDALNEGKELEFLDIRIKEIKWMVSTLETHSEIIINVTNEMLEEEKKW